MGLHLLVSLIPQLVCSGSRGQSSCTASDLARPGYTHSTHTHTHTYRVKDPHSHVLTHTQRSGCFLCLSSAGGPLLCCGSCEGVMFYPALCRCSIISTQLDTLRVCTF